MQRVFKTVVIPNAAGPYDIALAAKLKSGALSFGWYAQANPGAHHVFSGYLPPELVSGLTSAESLQQKLADAGVDVTIEVAQELVAQIVVSDLQAGELLLSMGLEIPVAELEVHTEPE